MMMPSELEVWLADGPDIEEIVDRFEQLEAQLEAHEQGVGWEVFREDFRQLEAKLLAHIKNEGDECPLCSLEAEIEKWQDAVDYDEHTDTVHFDHDKIRALKEGE